MISPRRACLALFLVGVASCDIGCSDASKDLASTPAAQQRAAQLERFKARPARPARKPGR